MDTKLTQRMQDWLEAKPADRSLEEGAELVLKLTGNQFLHRNIMVRKDFKMIEYQLRKYLPKRLQEVTHEEVERMKKEAAKIVEDHHLDTIRKSAKTPPEEWKKGKRQDHDSLPEDIQALYAENLNILHRMREVHLQTRKIALADKPCSDCDIYPFVKELIELDKRYHDNWKAYDEYGREETAEDAE